MNFYKPTNMNDASAWGGFITNETSSNITVEDGAGRFVSYNGFFTYSYAGLSGGTLTDFSEYTDYSLLYSVSGLAVNALTLKQYMQAGDTFGLLDYAAGGSDTFYGSSGVDVIESFAGNDDVFGYGGDDVLYGGAGDDDLYGGSGNDYLGGDSGTDWAIFDGSRGSYTMRTVLGGYSVTDSLAFRDGSDTLAQVERAVFSDMSVNLGAGVAAQSIAPAQLDSLVELYIAYINRVPDADGMVFWISQLQAGKTLNQIGESFYNAAVQYSSLTGYSATMSNSDFVRVVYSNVLERDQPDSGGLAFWTNELNTGHSSRGTLVASILASAHSFKGHATYGWVADLLDNKIEVGTIFAIEQGLVYNTSETTISVGMDIADAVTPYSINQALDLIGVNDGFSLY